MNDDSRAVAEAFTNAFFDSTAVESEPLAVIPKPAIPGYLQETYWWAYLHPKSIQIFEQKWLVNLILWGNMKRLTNVALDELEVSPRSRVLQVACVYGDFSQRLAARLRLSQSRLELVDVAPIQLSNATTKLAQQDNISFHHQDSSRLSFSAARFDTTYVFFLLHEQPDEVRRKTIAEAIRVTRPGGKLIFVDYHSPKRSNPLRYLMRPVLAWLEPFALDLWHQELPAFFPVDIKPEQISTAFYFGGLYQKVVLKL